MWTWRAAHSPSRHISSEPSAVSFRLRCQSTGHRAWPMAVAASLRRVSGSGTPQRLARPVSAVTSPDAATGRAARAARKGCGSVPEVGGRCSGDVLVGVRGASDPQATRIGVQREYLDRVDRLGVRRVIADTE